VIPEVKFSLDAKEVELLRRQLHSLGRTGAGRASRKAIRAGLKVVERAIKATAPVGPARRVKGRNIVGGTLRNAVGSRFITDRRANGIDRAKVGLNVGKGRAPVKGSTLRKQDYAPHAHLVALGTQPRWAGVKYSYIRRKGKRGLYNPKGDKLTGKRVRYTGVMPANPFARWAAEKVEGSATAEVRKAFQAAFEAEVAREAAKK
jgi:HK97 gp10 family phage protein